MSWLRDVACAEQEIPMDCWIYKDGLIESSPITGGALINLVRDGQLSRFSEIRSAPNGEWQTIESSEFREFLPGEQTVAVVPPVRQTQSFGCGGMLFVVAIVLLAIVLLAASAIGHGGSGGILIVALAVFLFVSIGWVPWALLLFLGVVIVIAIRSRKSLIRSDISASAGSTTRPPHMDKQ